MYDSLVKQFCTPVHSQVTESEIKAISGFEKIRVEFEDEYLNCYACGEGRTVILAHGWSSRASHMVLMAKYLSGFGFRVITFDAPAHYSSVNFGSKNTSNMFEFGRALSAVAHHFDKVYAVVGHSLGAISGVFTMAGFLQLEGHSFGVEKLVLISSPSKLSEVLRNFSSGNGLSETESEQLKSGLEKGFDMSVDDYDVRSVIKEINAEILVIHDANDEDIPLQEAFNICTVGNNIHLFVTSNYGHQKILINRKVFGEIKNFLLK